MTFLTLLGALIKLWLWATSDRTILYADWGGTVAGALMTLTATALILLSLLSVNRPALKASAKMPLRILVSALLLPLIDILVGFGLMVTLRLAGILTFHGLIIYNSIDSVIPDKNVFTAAYRILPAGLIVTTPVTFALLLTSFVLWLVTLVFDVTQMSAQRASLITYCLALPSGVLAEIWLASYLLLSRK